MNTKHTDISPGQWHKNRVMQVRHSTYYIDMASEQTDMCERNNDL